MALKEKTKQTYLSADPDKADKSGFLHGVRATLSRVRAILYNYPNKDGVGSTNDDGSEVRAPGLMVDIEVKGGETYHQFYANGSADQRVPSKDGHAFVAVPGAKVSGALVEGSNAYLFVAALKSCGWPSGQLATGDYSAIDGTVVDLIAQPVGSSKRAKAEGERQRTIAVVGKIVTYPDGIVDEAGDEPEDSDDEDETPAKPAKKKPAPADDEDEDADTDTDTDDDDDEDEPPAKSKKPADDDDDDDDEDDDEDPLTTEAQEYVATVLQLKKYRGKSIELTDLSREVLILAKANKNRQKIVALVQDPAFHKAASALWSFDKKAKTISIEE